MKKNISEALIVTIIVLGFLYIYFNQPLVEDQNGANPDDVKVENLVKEFGGKLKLVSLLAPDVSVQIENTYSQYVSKELIDQWKKDPKSAPGKLTSSPWPDHIEIERVKKIENTSTSQWEVFTDLIDATSDKEHEAVREAYFVVENINGKLLITEFNISDYDVPLSLEYKNDAYGFIFALPVSWQGYKILKKDWIGYINDEKFGQKEYTRGPEIIIRNPKWTEKVVYQDIPIMIFSITQWDELVGKQQGPEGRYYVSAAPIPPSEIGRNSKYVFAIPPRFDWAYPEGYKEVENILSRNPLRTF